MLTDLIIKSFFHNDIFYTLDFNFKDKCFYLFQYTEDKQHYKQTLLLKFDQKHGIQKKQGNQLKTVARLIVQDNLLGVDFYNGNTITNTQVISVVQEDALGCQNQIDFSSYVIEKDLFNSL